MSFETTPEGWAQRWQTSAVAKPAVRTIDIHTHILVPESADLTRPHFKPEMDPRTFFSSPVTKELNGRFYELVAPKYTDTDTRLEDMDALGIDTQLIGLSPFHYFYWADAHLARITPRLGLLDPRKRALADIHIGSHHGLAGRFEQRTNETLSIAT